VLFLRELRDQQQVKQAMFLVDGAMQLASALSRLGVDFRYKSTEIGRCQTYLSRGKTTNFFIFKYVQPHVAPGS
jgi:transposase-like protein